MSPWLETLAVCGLAMLGYLLGRWFSRLPKPYWLLGYFIPLIVIIIIGVGRRNSGLELTPPVSWIMYGRTPFALSGLLAAMLLTTPLSRLSTRRLRVLVLVLMLCIVVSTSVWPFLAPAFNRNFWRTAITRFDAEGVCLQTSSYSCGPAAAVTALRKLGIPSEEGELAILAHTSDAMGTPPGILCQTLKEKFGASGLSAQLRHFNSLAELKQAGLTLALIKFGFLVDHYLVIFEVTDRDVIVGDPIVGKSHLSHADFMKKWRKSGIVLQRVTAAAESG